MFEFIAYTTVDFSFKITPKEKLLNFDQITVSLKQNNTQINKTRDELGIDTENGIINMHLSQEETAEFKKGDAKVQVNIYYENTRRRASYEKKVKVLGNLLEEFMPYE